MLGDSAIDGGLFGLHAGADVFYICSQQPADYTSASSTFALGVFNGGPGNILTSPSSVPGGRKVSLIPVAGGSTIASGTAAYWAIVDSANLHLLATGPALPSQIIPPGAVWQFSTFDIGFLAGQLQGIDLVLASPVLGQPAMSIAGSGAVSLVVGSPILGVPVATNTWALSATGINVGSPTLGTPASLSTETLVAVNLVPASPILGQPTMFGGVTPLTAIELDVQPPVFGAPVAFPSWPGAANIPGASALLATANQRSTASASLAVTGNVLARAQEAMRVSSKLAGASTLAAFWDNTPPTVPTGLTAQEIQVYNSGAAFAGVASLKASATISNTVNGLSASNFIDSSPKLDNKPAVGHS